MSKILVTGGAGYTGTALVERLLFEGHRVTILDNLMFGVEPLLHLINHHFLTVVRGDVRDPRLDLSAYDGVFHLAGISGYPACEANPGAAYTVNVDGTRNIVSKLDSPHQWLINASTTSFYGASKNESRETDEVTPVNLYGETKYAAEQICMEHENTISLRWATVFGVSSRMRHDLMINDFVNRARTDGVIVLYDADSMRTFIHIADQVAGYMAAANNLKNYMQAGIVNMGSTRFNLTKLQIAEAVREVVPCEIILAETKSRDVRNFIANFDTARALGFDCQCDLELGIMELAKFYHLKNAMAVL